NAASQAIPTDVALPNIPLDSRLSARHEGSTAPRSRCAPSPCKGEGWSGDQLLCANDDPHPTAAALLRIALAHSRCFASAFFAQRTAAGGPPMLPLPGGGRSSRRALDKKS